MTRCQLARRFCEITRRTDVGRQVTQVTREIHAGADGAGLFGRRAGFGRVVARNIESEFLQTFATFLLATLELFEAVFAIGKRQRGMAYFPGQVAPFEFDIVRIKLGIARARIGQRAGDGLDHAGVIALVHVAVLAAAHQQHPLYREPGHVGEQQGLPQTAFHIASLQHCAEKSLAGLVDPLSAAGQFSGLAHANDLAGAACVFCCCMLEAELHDFPGVDCFDNAIRYVKRQKKPVENVD